MNPIVVRSTIVAALGGLLFGFDTAVISGTTADLESVFALSKQGLGFTVSIALIGTMIGALLVERPVSRWGRRPTLMTIAVLYALSAVGTALPWDWYSFLFFRFIGGLAVGGSSVVAPMYISEISPAKWRGQLVACTQLNIILGILFAYLSNFILIQLSLGEDCWRWMFGVEVVPAVLFGLLLFATPESPRWLVAKGLLTKARSVFEKIGTDAGNIDEEIAIIQESLHNDRTRGENSLFTRKYAWPIFLALSLAIFNQLSGINAILYYAPAVFQMAGASKELAMFQPILVGLVMLVFTVLALFVIDRLGRKRLMLLGSIGYILSLATATIAFYHWGDNFPPAGSYLVLIAILVFIAAHSIGQGAVIWVYISEIFPARVRVPGQVLACFMVWFVNAIVAGTFPALVESVGPAAVFGIFTSFMIIQLFWVIFLMVETKGIPLEEMEKHL